MKNLVETNYRAERETYGSKYLKGEITKEEMESVIFPFLTYYPKESSGDIKGDITTPSTL